MCLVGIALLLRAGLAASQEAAIARQKSAEGIVGRIAGEGLKALQSERRSQQINRTVTHRMKARTVLSSRGESKWSG